MTFSTSLVVALAAGLMAATPVLAQSNTDAARPDTTSPSNAAKRPTSGMPVGAQPKKYGEPAEKQKTSGMPVGAQPQKYGSPDSK
jgi:hypothetical protein